MILTHCWPKVKCTPIVKTFALFLLWKNLPNKFPFYCVRGKWKREASQLGQKAPHAEGSVFTALRGLSCSTPATSFIQHLLPGSAMDWLLEEEKGRQMFLLRFQSFRSHWLHEIQIPQVFLNLSQDGQITMGDRTSLWAETWNQKWWVMGLLEFLLRTE